MNYNTNYERFSGGMRIGNKYPAVHGDDKPFDPSPLFRLSKNLIIWGANCFSDKLPLGSWLIWDKRFDNGEAFLADGEAAWMNKGFGIYIFSQTSQGFHFPDGIRRHPTQKPVALMRWCIEKFPKADLILDPFCGVGSTLVAAKQLGRRFIGFEIEQRYVDIANERLKQEVLAL